MNNHLLLKVSANDLNSNRATFGANSGVSCPSVANVSRDWIVFEESLVCGGLLGDRKHPGRVSRHVPDCRVAGGRV